MIDTNIYYTLRGIYGIKIYNCIDNNDFIILFEKKYNEIMSTKMMEEAMIFYKSLNENNKQSVKFKIYKKCK